MYQVLAIVAIVQNARVLKKCTVPVNAVRHGRVGVLIQ